MSERREYRLQEAAEIQAKIDELEEIQNSITEDESEQSKIEKFELCRDISTEVIERIRRMKQEE